MFSPDCVTESTAPQPLEIGTYYCVKLRSAKFKALKPYGDLTWSIMWCVLTDSWKKSRNLFFSDTVWSSLAFHHISNWWRGAILSMCQEYSWWSQLNHQNFAWCLWEEVITFVYLGHVQVSQTVILGNLASHPWWSDRKSGTVSRGQNVSKDTWTF